MMDEKNFKKFINQELDLIHDKSFFDGIWILDLLEQKVIHISNEFWSLLGFEPDQIDLDAIISKNLIRQLNPFDLVETAVKSGKTVFRSNKIFTHINGHEKLLMIKGLLTPKSNGVNKKAILFFGDFTNFELDKKLKIRSNHFDQIIEGTDLCTWEWNIPSKEVLTNNNWAGLVGYPMEDLKNIDINFWLNLIHPADKDITLNKLFDHIRNKTKSYEAEVRLKHKDGHWVWTLTKGKVITRKKNGKAILMIGYHQDISETKKIGNTLNRTNELFEDTMDVAQIGSWEVDLMAQKLSWSKVTKQIFEVESDYLPTYDKGLNFFQKGIEQEKISNTIKNTVETGEKFDIELKFNTAKDNSKWIRIIGQAEMEAKEITSLKGIVQDISSNRKEIEELQKNYRQIKLFIEQAPSAIAMFDKNLNYITASEQWYIDYGIEGREIIGKSHFDIFPHIDKSWSEIYKSCLDGANLKSDEEEFTRLDGKKQWLKWEIKPWKNTNNEIEGLIMYSSDITSLKSSRTETESLMQQLLDQNDRLMNFSHIVSHNLRSHTVNLNSLLKMMKGEFSEVNNSPYFQMFEKACNNISDTISHLREVASMNSNTDEGMMALDLNEYIEKSITAVKAKSIEVEGEIINDIKAKVQINAIPAYLDSIILNLLTNSIKYRQLEQRVVINIGLETTDEYTILSIKDNGLGIDLEKYGSKLFGMYKVFHHHKDSRGIGLFITKSQIEAMKGLITVESTPLQGSTFKVHFRN
ncbi:hypothetical protein DNU06_04255 [Putridiphycobacter roseus]|uniref:histidine kinase n=1 Tax=Putridiphycobacter roseus TaxID=2219161 RepID=A0A2W1N0R0_9FLAO|nr:PAS domain-containing protein [Putridiphycobacter roseus]PZE17837.1 hypothetical protein DNU06_04255 [Putridiphycobacter roseus]